MINPCQATLLRISRVARRILFGLVQSLIRTTTRPNKDPSENLGSTHKTHKLEEKRIVQGH